MTQEEMISRLRETQDERRFAHTLGVAQEAVRLAPRFGVDLERARTAALLHDCAKNFDKSRFFELCQAYGVELDDYAKQEPALVHAFLGAAVAERDYGITDREILDAIYYHTTARADMTPLDKLIYLADMTEPGRTMPQAAEIRTMLEKDLDEALIYAIGCSIKHVIRKGTLIHPDSVHARNDLINKRRNSHD